MQGQDDRSKDALRSSRQFQPSVDQPLEKRDLPATLAGVPLSVNSALAGTPLIGAAKAGKSISANDWNSFAGWSWLKGVWKSNTKIDFMQAVAKSMGGKSIHFPSVPSLDTWLVGDNQYIGRTALAAQQNTDMPLDGLVIKPATTGSVTTLSMTSADGTPPVELKLTSTNSTTATFTGKTPVDATSTNPSDPVNVRVVITKRNTNSLRIIAEMQTGSSWVRMFTYTATRTKFTAV
jgi:hypothetical protein